MTDILNACITKHILVSCVGLSRVQLYFNKVRSHVSFFLFSYNTSRHSNGICSGFIYLVTVNRVSATSEQTFRIENIRLASWKDNTSCYCIAAAYSAEYSKYPIVLNQPFVILERI